MRSKFRNHLHQNPEYRLDSRLSAVMRVAMVMETVGGGSAGWPGWTRRPLNYLSLFPECLRGRLSDTKATAGRRYDTHARTHAHIHYYTHTHTNATHARTHTHSAELDCISGGSNKLKCQAWPLTVTVVRAIHRWGENSFTLSLLLSLLTCYSHTLFVTLSLSLSLSLRHSLSLSPSLSL